MGDNMFEYINKMQKKFCEVGEKNNESIIECSKLIYKSIIEDKIIHILGTGHSHMVGLESFIRAGGLANINVILDSTVLTADGAIRSSKMERVSGIAEILFDSYKIDPEDLVIVISNSGRNALPLEFAMLAKKNGNSLVVITSLEQSKQYPSRHFSGKKLYEIGDIILDNCVPSGDGIISIQGENVGGVSTLTGMVLLTTAITEGMKLAENENIDIPIFTSQNIDEKNRNNELYQRFGHRIKHT